MKTIIIVAYISGIVYNLICTNIFKEFANLSREVLEEGVDDKPIPESMMQIAKLVVDLIMFVGMLVTITLWPIWLLYDLFIKIKYECWKIRFIRKIKKTKKKFEKMLEEKD